jgi:hypothetical protein
MQSSGMLRSVALVRTDVSEERMASIIKVTRIGELGTTLAVTSNRSTLRNISVLTKATRRNMPEDGILHSRRSANLKNLKTYIMELISDCYLLVQWDHGLQGLMPDSYLPL